MPVRMNCSDDYETSSSHLNSLRGDQLLSEEEEDLNFYEDTVNIQQQYSLYEYEYGKNYKSWGSNVKGDMMTNKEYIMIWEWFRDTLKGVKKEERIIVKTLAYYCVANGLFENYNDAFTYFDVLHLTHENLVLSFTELINEVSNTSNEHSVMLRNHIKGKPRRKNAIQQPLSLHDTQLLSAMFPAAENSSSLPTLGKDHSPTKKLSKGEKQGKSKHCKESSHFLPPIPPSKSTQRPGNGESNNVMASKRSSKNSIAVAVTSQLHRNVNGQGPFSNIRGVVRRQLSRLVSSDNIKGGASHEKGEESKKKTKKVKQKNKKSHKSEQKVSSENSLQDKDDSNTEKSTEGGGVLSSVGRTIRRQLSRLASLSDK